MRTIWALKLLISRQQLGIAQCVNYCRMGKPIAQVALNWLRQKPEVTSIINGVSSISQLQKNIASTEWDIPDDYMAKINQAIAPFENL